MRPVPHPRALHPVELEGRYPHRPRCRTCSGGINERAWPPPRAPRLSPHCRKAESFPPGPEDMVGASTSGVAVHSSAIQKTGVGHLPTRQVPWRRCFINLGIPLVARWRALH